jgi:hypothetical protein
MTGETLTMFEPDAGLKPFAEAIAAGRSSDLEQQLVTKSRESHILKYTPNDAGSRFKSHESFENWISNGREVYWLLGAENDLGGIIWYGKKTLPQLEATAAEIPTETFAIRLYEGYVRRRLAVPFIIQTLRLSVQNKHAHGEPAVGIWLETGEDNMAAQKIYQAVGFHEIGRSDKRLTYVLSSTNAESIALHVSQQN